MPKADMFEIEGVVVFEIEGVVVESLPGAKFKVDVGYGRTVTAHLSGKMRTNYIKVLVGDKVALEMSPYDTTKGRIIWRNNGVTSSNDSKTVN